MQRSHPEAVGELRSGRGRCYDDILNRVVESIKEVQDTDTHFRLRDAVIDHLWKRKGGNCLADS